MQRGNEPFMMYPPQPMPMYEPQPRRRHRTRLGCFNSTIKLVFCLANTAFTILGLALLVIGVINKVEYLKSLVNLSIADFTSLEPLWLMVAGTVIVLVAGVGCYGAKNNSPCLLILYGVILLGLVAVQLSLSIYQMAAVDYKQDLRSELTKQFAAAVAEEDKPIPEMQRSFQCCGVDGPDDFKNNSDWSQKLLSFCCKKGRECEEPEFKRGCADAMEEALNNFVNISSGTGFAVAVAALIAAFVAFKLAFEIRSLY